MNYPSLFSTNYFIMKTSLLLVGLLFLCSCIKEGNKIEKYHQQITIVSDSIESMMPGNLLLYPDHIVWTDPFGTEQYVHILDKSNGKEIAKIVNKGQGPSEFANPSISKALDNRFFIFSVGEDKAAYFSIDTHESPAEYISINQTGETRYIEIEKNKLLSFNPTAKQPFQWNNALWGKFTFDQITNNISVSQGNISYHPNKNYVVYAVMEFPYMALYKLKDHSMELLWEKKGDIDYQIVEGELKLNRSKKGAGELALTTNYIVTLERDYTVDNTDESTVGRNMEKLPRTVFLYDYKGNLKKIVDLGMPILRLAADPSENTVYAIGVNPDFVLVKFDIF